MKRMTIVTVVLVVLVAALFVGCKYIRGQILDGPGMERDSADYSVEEPVDGLNKEAILDGPDGTSTHAFTGSKNSVEVDLLDIEEMPKSAVPLFQGKRRPRRFPEESRLCCKPQAPAPYSRTSGPRTAL